MNYYNQIKDLFIKNEVYKQVKDYSKNRSDLNTYYEVGKLLIEAQGGEGRAKYGNKIIKEYSDKLTKELGKGYNITNLKNMRQFYLVNQKGRALRDQLSWTHYRVLLPLKNKEEIDYYIDLAIKQNLSYRDLRERIKSKEYERIGYKEELEEPKINTLIQNPIIIKIKKIPDKLTEYALHQFILEDISSFLKQLGDGFCYIDDEVKIKINEKYHRIDFLLYNIKFNCYVVVELKVGKELPEHIGQIIKYMQYVDKNIKEPFNDKTVGIIICKREDKFVVSYSSDYSIFSTKYILNEI